MLNAAICIEIDVESGQVYSVFYGTNCKGLYYGSNEDSKPADMSGSWLDIDYSKRDRDTRREERLGYYSVQDAVNAVSLDATKLKITSINLVNGETLSLNWSSNVKDQDLDKVYYEVKLYSSEDKAQLLSINIPGRNLKTGSQSVAVTTEDNATKDYTIAGERGSGMICLNGAAARCVSVGDKVILMAYAQLTPEEVRNGYAPQVVFVDEENKIVRTTTYEKHGLLKDMA